MSVNYHSSPIFVKPSFSRWSQVFSSLKLKKLSMLIHSTSSHPLWKATRMVTYEKYCHPGRTVHFRGPVLHWPSPRVILRQLVAGFKNMLFSHGIHRGIKEESWVMKDRGLQSEIVDTRYGLVYFPTFFEIPGAWKQCWLFFGMTDGGWFENNFFQGIICSFVLRFFVIPLANSRVTLFQTFFFIFFDLGCSQMFQGSVLIWLVICVFVQAKSHQRNIEKKIFFLIFEFV